MRLLLDTHAFLWAVADPARLGRQAELVEDPRNDVLVSAATSWEIAIKVGLGRLDLPAEATRWVPDSIRGLAATPLAIEHAHALAAGTLPPVHRDPFDRLLIAQATVLGVPVLTADPVFASYPIEVLAIG